MLKELPKPWMKLHAGVRERDTFLKGDTRMRVLSREDMPDGSIRFVASPDGQVPVTAEVSILAPANDADAPRRGV